MAFGKHLKRQTLKPQFQTPDPKAPTETVDPKLKPRTPSPRTPKALKATGCRAGIPTGCCGRGSVLLGDCFFCRIRGLTVAISYREGVFVGGVILKGLKVSTTIVDFVIKMLFLDGKVFGSGSRVSFFRRVTLRDRHVVANL